MVTVVIIVVVELVFINCSFVLLNDYQKLFTEVIQVRQQTKLSYKCSFPLYLFQHLDVKTTGFWEQTGTNEEQSKPRVWCQNLKVGVLEFPQYPQLKSGISREQ